nr:pentatricopeptide repeat-containing protein At2g22410, mitochondrial-like [Setaria viridis]
MPPPSRLALLTAGNPPPLRLLLQLHAHLLVSGLLSSPSPFASRLVPAFALTELASPRPLLHALALLASLPSPPDSASPYNLALRALSLCPHPHLLDRHCLPLYRALLSSGSARPDHLTFPFLLKACARVRERFYSGGAVLAHVTRLGFNSDVFVVNAAMNYWSVCGSMADARRLFQESVVRDVVSWNTLIGGYVRKGLPGEALEVFWRMAEEGTLGDLELGKRLHEFVESNGVRCAVRLKNAVMDRLGTMQDARKLFDEMPERDALPWNALMAGYVQSKQGKEAIALFHEMQEAKTPASLSVALGTSLVGMYAKCGNIKKAICIFKEVPEKNALAWTAMVCGLANHGHADEAIEHFRRMIELGLQPDDYGLTKM